MLYHNWPNWGLLDSEFSKLASELFLHCWTLLSVAQKEIPALCFFAALCFALSASCTRSSPDSCRFL